MFRGNCLESGRVKLGPLGDWLVDLLMRGTGVFLLLVEGGSLSKEGHLALLGRDKRFCLQKELVLGHLLEAAGAHSTGAGLVGGQLVEQVIQHFHLNLQF